MENTNELSKEPIFQVMTNLSKKYDAIDLGKGFPNFDCQTKIKKLALEAMIGNNHQYCSTYGHVSLRESISTMYKELYSLTYDKNDEVTVTCGAQEAICSTLNALIGPGDEVLIFEPFYCLYVDVIKSLGATPKFIRLSGNNFEFSINDLESQITSKTKLMILNTPHNPTGKVFTMQELENISQLIQKHQIIVLSDEVYEHYTYEDHKHIPMATVKGMKDHVITISSLGKTFGITGWKIGYICAPKSLSGLIRESRGQFIGSVAAPLQVAGAKMLKLLTETNYILDLQKSFSKKRDIVSKSLEEMGIKFYKTQGSFFTILDISSLSTDNDFKFCIELVQQHGLALIPMSSFFSDNNENKKLVRLCFAKKDKTLEQALKIIRKSIIKRFDLLPLDGYYGMGPESLYGYNFRDEVLRL
jgi:aspartate/methionine/tyrosine aminotransferase